MKSTQDKFKLVTEGKIDEKDFLKEVKRNHRDIISPSTTYKDAVNILKNKDIINEHFLGIVTQKPVNNITPDWFKIFNDNVLKEEEKDTKAELKNPDKDVVELETKGYDYKNKDNVNNMNFNEYLTGYYCEMKNPKNAEKTESELKEIVKKNLEKNPLHYVEGGQFGEEIGYTADAPGLKASKSDQMVPVKEGRIKLGDLVNENWFNPTINEDNEDNLNISSDDAVEAEEMEQEGSDVTEDARTDAEEEGYLDGMHDEKDDLKNEDARTDAEEEGYLDGMHDEKEDLKKENKRNKKMSLEAKLREIENLGRATALEAKIQAVAEEITMRQDKLQVAENMDEVADFINPVRIKETKKEIKLLEKKRAMYEKMYKKLTKEDYKAPVVDEELDIDPTPEV